MSARHRDTAGGVEPTDAEFDHLLFWGCSHSMRTHNTLWPRPSTRRDASLLGRRRQASRVETRATALLSMREPGADRIWKRTLPRKRPAASDRTSPADLTRSSVPVAFIYGGNEHTRRRTDAASGERPGDNPVLLVDVT